MNKIFVLTGKSCSGKDTVAREISRIYNLPVIVNYTSRPAREGEKNGESYNFTTMSKLLSEHEKGDMVAVTRYVVANNDVWYYGTKKEDIEKHDYSVIILNPEGAEELKKEYGDKVCVMYLNASIITRFSRYSAREKLDDDKLLECFRRFLADEKDFTHHEYDYMFDTNSSSPLLNLSRITSAIMSEVIKDAIKVDSSVADFSK